MALGAIVGIVYRVSHPTTHVVELWDANPENNEPIYGEIKPLPHVFNIPDHNYETPVSENELYYSDSTAPAVYDVATPRSDASGMYDSAGPTL